MISQFFSKKRAKDNLASKTKRWVLMVLWGCVLHVQSTRLLNSSHDMEDIDNIEPTIEDIGQPIDDYLIGLSDINSEDMDCYMQEDSDSSHPNMFLDEQLLIDPSSDIAACIEPNTIPLTENTTEKKQMTEREKIIARTVEEFRIYFNENRPTPKTRLAPMLFLESLVDKTFQLPFVKDILEQCVASEEWIGDQIFWSMLAFFVDTLSLDIWVYGNEEHRNIVQLDCKYQKDISVFQPPIRPTQTIVSRCLGTQNLEIVCDLELLTPKDTVILGWLLRHVGITFIWLETQVLPTDNPSMVRQKLQNLTKTYGLSGAQIKKLDLGFHWKQYEDIWAILEAHSCLTTLMLSEFKMPHRFQNIENLVYMLRLCPRLEQLYIPKMCIYIDGICKVLGALPGVAKLEVGEMLFYAVQKTKEKRPSQIVAHPGVKELKIIQCKQYSADNLKELASLVPNLTYLNITTPRLNIDTAVQLADLPKLKDLIIGKGILDSNTVSYLAEALLHLNYLSICVERLDIAIAQALARSANMKVLILNGIYTPDFLTFIFQSSLLNTLKKLTIFFSIENPQDAFSLSHNDIITKQDIELKSLCRIYIREA
ncbi:hypothetical protein NECID01_1485 [Nematocida sp. AWRm77]|nr:hypothetical protein NECID01_1485 [Nematocida sp. AWRm77]